MIGLFSDFTWWRDQARRFELSRDGKRIVWTGHTGLQQYKPLVVWRSKLVEDFAQVRTAADALEFVQVFGFLNLFKHDDPLEAVIKQHHEGEEVDHILVMATSIREFLDEAVKGPRAVYRMLVDHGGMLMINVELALVPDHRTKSARMRYSIWSLYRAIVLQMCASVTEEGEYRLCLFHKCGRHFLASPEADRNRNSKFCCTNHRIAYNSLNRSKGS